MPKAPTPSAEIGTSADPRAHELEKLLEAASRNPGIAELMAISSRHQAALAQMSAYLGARTRVVVTTTNTTGW